jgi:hypothetical protein
MAAEKRGYFLVGLRDNPDDVVPKFESFPTGLFVPELHLRLRV